MGNRAEVVLVLRLEAGVKALVGAEADRAVRVGALFVHATNVDLGLVAPVVVESVYGLPIVTRVATAQVRRSINSNLPESRQTAWKCTEGAETRTTAQRSLHLANCENLPVARIGQR